ncbi:DUF485 domain-containing protein [Kitasatospora sp. NPDC096147]|uniref:DUF485 domain-containing protein n=1 Tax=Kitasatospora sp. NPDC096147 TaxID=3364093 RepID=UPI00380EB1CB
METPSTPEGTPTEVQLIEQSEEFAALRRAFRGFVFPVTAGFLLWYLLYVLLSSYAHDFMAIKLFGAVNMALLLGLLQFASTFGIAAWYARYANRHLDPKATAIREGAAAANPREAGA